MKQVINVRRCDLEEIGTYDNNIVFFDASKRIQGLIRTSFYIIKDNHIFILNKPEKMMVDYVIK